MTTKPNFIIIGAMKAATTSLYTYLKQHPDIFMTSVKEPMFFNNYNKKNNYIIKGRKNKKITTLKQYYNLFNDVKKETAIGEASPSYISDKDCPIIIKENLPNIKIIAVLRQPVERAYSNYLHVQRSGKEIIHDFEEAFNEEKVRIEKNWSPLYHYKSKGFYFEQLNRYYNLFPKENIHIVLFEEIIKDPKSVSKKIFEFLNVDSTFIPDSSKQINVSGTPKGIFGWFVMKSRYYNLIPNIEFSKYLPQTIIKFLFNSAYSTPKKISNELTKKLTDLHYKDDILELEDLISKDLRHWLS